MPDTSVGEGGDGGEGGEDDNFDNEEENFEWKGINSVMSRRNPLPLQHSANLKFEIPEIRHQWLFNRFTQRFFG